MAILEGANLEMAILEGANLRSTMLMNANLKWAYLGFSDLKGAYLADANLECANFDCARLWGTNLEGANLKWAYLGHTNLESANLNNADLRGANLESANLNNTDLYSAQGGLMNYRLGKILTEDIIGYKKCLCHPRCSAFDNPRSKKYTVVTLKIPRGSIIFSISGNKCRTNRAKVIDILGADRAYSMYNNMSYYIGDEFNIYNFNCQYNIEYGEGIHFYMTLEEALHF